MALSVALNVSAEDEKNAAETEKAAAENVIEKEEASLGLAANHARAVDASAAPATTDALQEETTAIEGAEAVVGQEVTKAASGAANPWIKVITVTLREESRTVHH